MFSAQRWALTGEAGLFLDPFYSPGSDFIAHRQHLHHRPDRARPRRPALAARAQLYDQIYHSFYESTLALYTDQYPLFGDPEVLPVKVIWDYTYYWGVLAQIFFQRPPDRPGRCSAACARSWRTASSSTSRCRRSCAPGRRVSASATRP